jgi:hypothetical protein
MNRQAAEVAKKGEKPAVERAAHYRQELGDLSVLAVRPP